MKKIFCFFIIVLLFFRVQSQNFQISFAGTGISTVVNFVKVQNLTTGDTITINGTDVLTLVTPVGIHKENFEIPALKVYPNPTKGPTNISFITSKSGMFHLSLIDALGKVVTKIDPVLTAGEHSFQIRDLGPGTFLINIQNDDNSLSTKLVSDGATPGNPKFEYLSTANFLAPIANKVMNPCLDMPYTPGDILLYKGVSDQYVTLFADVPTGNDTITFTFVDCMDSDSNNYPAVMIGTQMWMAANLNVGVMVNNVYGSNQTNNNILEKYCYHDSVMNCQLYGGLYEWNEMMQYIFVEGTQGICPGGWHIPTAAEWANLVNYLGGVNNAGRLMKETGTAHWIPPNFWSSNRSGFTALPGGYRDVNGTFQQIGTYSNMWSSSTSVDPNAAGCQLNVYNKTATQSSIIKTDGQSVRCVQD